MNETIPASTPDVKYESMSLLELRQAATRATNEMEHRSITTAILRRAMDSSVERIPESAIEPFIKHIASDDENESEYGRKQLAQRLGNGFKPFYITSDLDGKELFYFPSVYMQFSTSTQEGQEAGYSMTSIHKSFVNSPFAQVPSKVLETVDQLGMMIGDTYQEQNPEEFFYGSWYEIFDYFNFLPEEESALYNEKRIQQTKGNYTFAWVREENMWSYLTQHKGRNFPGLLSDIPTLPNPDAKEDILAIPPEKRSEDINTDDWD